MSSSNRTSAIAIFCSFCCGVVVAALLFFATLEHAQVLEVQLEVSAVSGFNVANEKLYFGSIPPGGHGERQLLLENRHNRTVLMHLRTYGAVAPWLALDRAWVVVRPGEQYALGTNMWVPPNASFGNYSGSVEITTHRLG